MKEVIIITKFNSLHTFCSKRKVGNSFYLVYPIRLDIPNIDISSNKGFKDFLKEDKQELYDFCINRAIDDAYANFYKYLKFLKKRRKTYLGDLTSLDFFILNKNLAKNFCSFKSFEKFKRFDETNTVFCAILLKDTNIQFFKYLPKYLDSINIHESYL